MDADRRCRGSRRRLAGRGIAWRRGSARGVVLNGHPHGRSVCVNPATGRRCRPAWRCATRQRWQLIASRSGAGRAPTGIRHATPRPIAVSETSVRCAACVSGPSEVHHIGARAIDGHPWTIADVAGCEWQRESSRRCPSRRRRVETREDESVCEAPRRHERVASAVKSDVFVSVRLRDAERLRRSGPRIAVIGRANDHRTSGTSARDVEARGDHRTEVFVAQEFESLERTRAAATWQRIDQRSHRQMILPLAPRRRASLEPIQVLREPADAARHPRAVAIGPDAAADCVTAWPAVARRTAVCPRALWSRSALRQVARP